MVNSQFLVNQLVVLIQNGEQWFQSAKELVKKELVNELLVQLVNELVNELLVIG